jgi:hypothetical protein
MKIKLTFSVCLGLIFVSLPTFGQSTTFTYQGRLTDGSSPAIGLYDLRFSLWDGSTPPIQVSSTVTNVATAVSNGLFTVVLDFGASAFSGADRWLEVGVRTNGGGTFNTLTPRQKVTATPYALTAFNISGPLPSGSLSGTYANPLNFNNAANQFAGSFAGNGAGLSNLNAGTLGGLNSAQFWRTGGNNNAAPPTNFVGTTDNQPLELRVQNRRALRLEPATSIDVNFGFSPNVIGGYQSNRIAAGVIGATIAGGGRFSPLDGDLSHRITANHGTIGGGDRNTVSALDGTVAGGGGNTASGPYSSVGGGLFNTINSNAWYTTISGGAYSSIGLNSSSSTISGGYFHSIADNTLDATIGGGSYGSIGTNSYYATIAGGRVNSIRNNATSSSIGGGFQNEIRGNYATIPGGDFNVAGTNGFAAGHRAKAVHNGSFVWGDATDTDVSSTGTNQFVVRASGGVRFLTSGAGVTVDGLPVGGSQMLANDSNHVDIANVINGSRDNFIYPGVYGGTISGGGASNYFGGMGYSNSIIGDFGTVGGGAANVSGIFDSIGGGFRNRNIGYYCAIPGGNDNTIDGNTWSSTIGGGWTNKIRDAYNAVIAGGWGNFISASAYGATISGGGYNTNNGYCAMIPGGLFNFAVGGESFAAGYRAKANHHGAFVWSDNSQDADFASTAINQFLIRAAGGVGIGTTAPSAALHVHDDTLRPEKLRLSGRGYWNWSGVGDLNGISLVLGVNEADNRQLWITDSARTAASSANIALRCYPWNGGNVGIFDCIGTDGVTPKNLSIQPGGGSVGIGTTAPSSALLDVEGPVRINDQPLYLRGGDDPYHGLSYRFSYGGQTIDGPALYGYSGGVLGTFAGVENWSLRWNSSGQVFTRGAINPPSDRNVKDNFKEVNATDILAKVNALPITRWNYRDDPATEHIGPVAQDFHAAFGLGTDDKHIATVDADGVALAAIQGLNQKLDKLETELNRKESENKELKRRLEVLEKIVLQSKSD